MKQDLLQESRTAEKEDVIHGVPAGILIGFEYPDAWWEELLLRDPRFRARVAQARDSLSEGRGTRIEELREKFGSEPNAETGVTGGQRVTLGCRSLMATEVAPEA